MNVVYVSYDGALDPLGASQVVPYLVGLAGRGHVITLISFEKPERVRRVDQAGSMRRRLETSGIRWRPLTYHRTPRLLATLTDVVAGSRAIKAELARCSPAVVHCRGDVTASMARRAGLPSGTRLVYDVRGLFSDERVETGSWRRGSLLDRLVRRMEAGNLRRADGVVVLTRPAATELRRRRPSLPSLRVIPTCADVSMFTPRGAGEKAEFGLAYSGSLGTWYMGREMVAFAASTRGLFAEPPLFLTPQASEVRTLGATPDWAEARAVEPDDVPRWLRRARALFFFITPIPSKRASCPTKFAEGLAVGLPVVCNRGIGDLDQVVEAEGVGVLVDGFEESAYRDAGRRLQKLMADPALGERCRKLAETRYSIDVGVAAYDELYQAC